MSGEWNAPPLRLGLEPGYDGGRVGAWLLDVPGAFGWAKTRDAAVSQSSSVAGWWRDWLERHGDSWPAPWLGRPEPVEEVPATIDRGYERNATFVDDDVPMSGAHIETVIRRLGYAREDLVDVADRLPTDAWPAGGGERSVDDVLRHVGAVEIWLGSRLDPAARYPGRTDEPDVRRWLGETRDWAVGNLRQLHAAEVPRRTDSKGEWWTLRKVARRYLYHSVDHLRELDLRLARAERRTDRLRLTTNRLEDVGPLVRLLRSVGWDRRARDPERLGVAIGNSRAMVGAWDGDELVAFARELGDEAFNALISMVVVDPRWQGLGLARRLMETLMADRPNVRFMLNAAPGVEEYYARMGFEPDPSAMVRPRQGTRVG